MLSFSTFFNLLLLLYRALNYSCSLLLYSRMLIPWERPAS